jgi:hypothetical protein
MSTERRIKRTIAGREVELEAGRVYAAKWPVKSRDRMYSVLIVGDPRDPNGAQQDVITIHDLAYSEAQDFRVEFNNQDFTFTGRYWE